MSQRSAQHDTFTIERTFAAPPARVFRAFADREAKARWFGSPDDATGTTEEFDFRAGGRERMSGTAPGGKTTYRFDARYYDIVPDERIVYAYEMYLDDARISVSVATIELRPAGKGTRLLLTEQGVFLDGHDNVRQREQGTRELMDALARSLESEAVTA